MLFDKSGARIIPVDIVVSVAEAHGNMPTGSFESSDARVTTLECRRDKRHDVLKDTILQAWCAKSVSAPSVSASRIGNVDFEELLDFDGAVKHRRVRCGESVCCGVEEPDETSIIFDLMKFS
jgi:hypothetical protein